MKPNLVSCYCSTYGRSHCLEESIECFLRQDYDGPKELVILNDYEHQELVFDHPDVKVFNLPYRITPLGAKFNATVALCSGDVLCCWEDDDIYLPSRITHSLDNMKDGVFHTGDGFFETDVRDIVLSSNVFHATHVFTKELFDRVNGYPEKDQCIVDIDIMQKINICLGGVYSQPTKPENRFYIYRWSTVKSYHGSGWGSAKTDVSYGAELIVEDQRDKLVIKTGRIVLEPKWAYDYTKYLPTNLEIY